MADASPLIELKAVSKIYQMGDIELAALKDVNLRIDAGEFVAIMGSSGSGKSTLMNILGCLDRPTTGQYRLAGRDVSGLGRNALAEVRSSLIGFVFQSYNLLPRTSALENVELPLLYTPAPASERRSRASEALRRVGLADRVGHLPNQLSGGQQQRVAIARALANRPRLILADEPTGNLDSRTSIEIMALFQELWDAGMTLVIVTHETDIAAFAARRLQMRDGRIVADERQAPQRALDVLQGMAA